MPDHDVAEFRAELDTLTARERETIEARCKGMNAVSIAARDGTSAQTVSNCLQRVYDKAGSGSGGQNQAEAICYRLGYEQALADIEATIARKRAA